MRNPCDICIDPACDGKKNCNCSTCKSKEICPRLLGPKPTIRITTKCTQSCSHCCYECGPSSSKMMTIDMARNIHTFCSSNIISRCEIMGGEFFLNPDWEMILSILSDGMNSVRLVSNSDWAANEKISDRVIGFLSVHDNFHVGLSKDKWHNNKNVSLALKLLSDANIIHRTATEEEGSDNSIVPVGRGELMGGDFFSMFGCYCHDPRKKYNLLIDECGEIYKCGFGIWDYDNIMNFLNGGFGSRFKKFNTAFYKAWISNCASCNRSYMMRKAR